MVWEGSPKKMIHEDYRKRNLYVLVPFCIAFFIFNSNFDLVMSVTQNVLHSKNVFLYIFIVFFYLCMLIFLANASGVLVLLGMYDARTTKFCITDMEIVIKRRVPWRRERRMTILDAAICEYEKLDDGLYNVYFDHKPMYMYRALMGWPRKPLHIDMMFYNIPDGRHVWELVRLRRYELQKMASKKQVG